MAHEVVIVVHTVQDRLPPFVQFEPGDLSEHHSPAHILKYRVDLLAPHLLDVVDADLHLVGLDEVVPGCL